MQVIQVIADYKLYTLSLHEHNFNWSLTSYYHAEGGGRL